MWGKKVGLTRSFRTSGTNPRVFVFLSFNLPYLMGWLVEKPATLNHQEAQTEKSSRKNPLSLDKGLGKGQPYRTKSFLIIHVLSSQIPCINILPPLHSGNEEKWYQVAQPAFFFTCGVVSAEGVCGVGSWNFQLQPVDGKLQPPSSQWGIARRISERRKLKKVMLERPHDPACPLLSIYLKNTKH